MQGGGWCDTIRNCVYRKTTRSGSSKFMENQIPFSGILSNKAEENPGNFQDIQTSLFALAILIRGFDF